MGTILSKLAGSLVELLLPLNCAVCNRGGSSLCEGCQAALPELEEPYCSVCAGPGPARLCHWCAADRPAIEAIRAPFLFEGVLRDMVHSLKYRNLRASAPDMGRLLAGYLESHPVPADLLVPVPLHWWRERERGYNQSELLARELSMRAGIPVEAGVLRRTRNTPPQVSIESHEERRRSVEGAFECRLTWTDCASSWSTTS